MKVIDNQTVLLGDELKSTVTKGARIKIAASCFSIFAYEALKRELEAVESVEFFFTSPTFSATEVTKQKSRKQREFYIPKLNRERSLYGSDFEVHLRNKLNQKSIARECASWIRLKAKFKTNSTKSGMPAFMTVQAGESAQAFMPMNEFTAVGLGYQRGDAISNAVNQLDEPSMAKHYIDLFDQVWRDDQKAEEVTNVICAHIESVYQENSPEKIYFLILYNLFREFLEEVDEDHLPNDRTGYLDSVVWQKLFNYQRDAATGIINKLETFNGCILADSVGLGKTFTALAVIKYYELRNKSVLVLCPKKLADNWLTYNKNLKTNVLAKDRLNYDVLCHTDLLRTGGESYGIRLNEINWGNYDLVVIDESHNFRNNDIYKDKETRYQRLMRQVIQEGVKTKVLMLSATPVNNRFTDLRNQLALAYEGNSDSLSEKLNTTRSIEDIFRRAQKAFNEWSDLPADDRTAKAILNRLDFDFFELLDSVTIARSRKHIETFYDMADIGHFPERRKPISIRCKLTEREDVLPMNEIFKRLVVLKLAVYTPLSYILASRQQKYEDLYNTEVSSGGGNLRQADREQSLRNLMVTNLLKRLESSVEAFRLTLTSLQNSINGSLRAIEAFEASGSTATFTDFASASDDFDDEDDDLSGLGDFTVGKKIQISLGDMDVPRWKFELEEDARVIEALLAEMRRVTPKEDTKLQDLITHLKNKIENPINPGNRKVLIFTAFSDTAKYLYQNVAPELQAIGLEAAMVTGSDTPKTTIGQGFDFQKVLSFFSPRSKSRDLIFPKERNEIDVLIATDCISEGQNLQDCDYLINYDIHWNPVRIIQRFGRVDRIGSPNKEIQLVNYWPDISLDEYINLRERVENRMHIVDIAGTGEDNVLTAKSSDAAYRKEQLRKLQDEVIELEDVKAGVSITDLGLNDFRMDLVNYVKQNGDLDHVPNGMHAVVPANEAIGLTPGVIFALRNIHDSVNINQQNRLHPYYMIYVDQAGEVIADHMEVKRLLDLIRTSCKNISSPVLDVCRLFNARTDDGRNMEEYSELLSAAIRSMIELKEERDIDSLFSGGRTSALVDDIAGLDDFELIAFLVVEPRA